MATYYVDYVNGSDANNGLGPDASHASNKPWKTIGKLLGASGMASGDTAYLSPAGPFRETVTVAMTSATAETKVIGDPGNEKGFKTSGGVTVEAGPVLMSAYTTNDKTAPAASNLLNLSGRDYLTFQQIMFVGGNATTISATTTTSTNIKFTDCAFYAAHTGSASHLQATCAFNTPFNWTIDRCYFGPTTAANGLAFTLTTGSGSDYDCGVSIKNSVFFGVGSTRGIQVTNSGASANKGGGLLLRNCFFLGITAVTTTAGQISTSIPCQVNNCVLIGTTSGTAPLNAGTSGHITESYNLIVAATARNNVTAGTGSVSDGSYAPLYHFGQEQIWGMFPRNFTEPMKNSPILGFGNDGNQTAYDIRNKPRPAGGNGDPDPAAGAAERGNTFTKETGTVRTGSNAISITGPGYQEFLVPVDASSTTISVYVRWDATYAGTKPQFEIDANGEIGVSAETKTATGSSGSWEQLALSAFTPSAKGIVTVRVKSNDTNGGGHVYVDDFSVT